MEQQMPKDEPARDLVSMHQWTSPYLAKPLQVTPSILSMVSANISIFADILDLYGQGCSKLCRY